MRLHDLKPFAEERKNRKRVGRGSGTGWGKTSGKGHKGQNARSGGGVPAGFEGGQMPLARRLPKRGFKNFKFKTIYAPLNLHKLLATFEGASSISLAEIYDRGLAPRKLPVKVLADGDISVAVAVEAHAFSKAATEKITQAGGMAKIVERRPAPEAAEAEAPAAAPVETEAPVEAAAETPEATDGSEAQAPEAGPETGEQSE